MLTIKNVLSDRGSRYAVSGYQATSKQDAINFVQCLKKNKHFAKANHHPWALINQLGERIKFDDGKNGAGLITLRCLEQYELFNHVEVVTRWYGGTHLGGDHFRHVSQCAQTNIQSLKKTNNSNQTAANAYIRTLLI